MCSCLSNLFSLPPEQPVASGGTTGCEFTTNYYSGDGALIAFDENQCTRSITFNGQANICGVDSTYLDSSFVDTVARTETLTMGSYSGSTAFGAAYAASSDFIVAGADGIWGMSRPNPNWVFLQNGPLGTLFNAGMPKQFAMCMSSTGGDLHLGGYDSSYADGTISWFTFDAGASHYNLPLTAISVGSSAVSGSSGSVIFDSGSTFSLLPTSVYNGLVSAIESACPACSTAVFTSNSYQSVNPADYPTITLSFTAISGSTVTYSLTGAQYLWANPSNANQYTAGFEDSGSSTTWLFGQSFMRNWYTIFDVAYGVVGIGNLASGKCTAALTPTGDLVTLSPSTTKPPTSTGGLSPHANAPAPRAPIAATPDTAPGTVPTTGGGNPSNVDEPNAAPQQSAAVFSSVLVVLLATLFFFY